MSTLAGGSNNAAYLIASLLDKLVHPDSDVRYMAMSDLAAEYQRIWNSFNASSSSNPQWPIKGGLEASLERKLVPIHLSLLVDNNSEVRNQAMLCLGHFSRIAGSEAVDLLLQGLINLAIHDSLPDGGVRKKSKSDSTPGNPAANDVSGVGLKTLLTSIHPSKLNLSLLSKLLPFLFSAIQTSPRAGDLELLTTIFDTFPRGTITLQGPVQSHLLGSLYPLIDETKFGLRKKVILALMSIGRQCDGAGVLVMEQLGKDLQSFSSPSTSNLIKCTGRILCLMALCPSSSAAPLAPVQLVIQQLSQEPTCWGEEIDGVDEWKEASLSLLRLVFTQFPNEVINAGLLDSLTKLALLSSTFDPHFIEGMDEDSTRGDDDEFGSEIETEEDEDGFSDEEDASYRVRKAALKLLQSLISSAPNFIIEEANLLSVGALELACRRIPSERNESVQHEMFDTLLALVNTMLVEEVVASKDPAITSLLIQIVKLLPSAAHLGYAFSFLSAMIPFGMIIFGPCEDKISSLVLNHIKPTPGISAAQMAFRKKEALIFLAKYLTAKNIQLSHETIRNYLSAVAEKALPLVDESLPCLTALIEKAGHEIGETSPLAHGLGSLVSHLKACQTTAGVLHVFAAILVHCTQASPTIVTECESAMAVFLKSRPLDVLYAYETLCKASTTSKASLVAKIPVILQYVQGTHIDLKNQALIVADAMLARPDMRASCSVFIPYIHLDTPAMIIPCISLMAKLIDSESLALPSVSAFLANLEQLYFQAPLSLGSAVAYTGLEELWGALIRAQYSFELNGLLARVDESTSKATCTLIARLMAILATNEVAGSNTVGSFEWNIALFKNTKNSDASRLIVLQSLKFMKNASPDVDDVIRAVCQEFLGDDQFGAVASDVFASLLIRRPSDVPTLLACIQASPEKCTTPGLHALASYLVLLNAHSSALSFDDIKLLWDFCLALSRPQNVSAELGACLARLYELAPTLDLATLILPSSGTDERSIGLRNAGLCAFKDISRIDIELPLSPVVACINESHLATAELALSVLGHRINHRDPRVISQPSLLAAALEGMLQVDPSKIEVVEMGPFKHKVDKGLPCRKTAYDCMFSLMGQTSKNLFTPTQWMDLYVRGITDESNEIKISVLFHLTKNPVESVKLDVDRLVPVLQSVLALKPKINAVKQEIEKLAELTNAAKQAIDTLIPLISGSGGGGQDFVRAFGVNA